MELYLLRQSLVTPGKDKDTFDYVLRLGTERVLKGKWKEKREEQVKQFDSKNRNDGKRRSFKDISLLL